jgi:hypothetical protein
VWTRDGNLPGAPMTWEQALAWVKGRNLCGWEDWRLPNVNELESLIHSGEFTTSTWLENLPLGFTNIQNDYCSSTTSLYNPERVWSVGMGAGNLYSLPKDRSVCNVWPVRYVTSPPAALWKTGQTLCYNTAGSATSCEGTGQDGDLQKGVAWPAPRFTDHGNGTVTDELTGLIWAKDANAPGPSQCYPGTYKSWYGTYTYIQCLNQRSYLGFNDWRLPNRKELRSLIDYSQQDPALPPGHPFTNVQVDYDYRSSTGVAYLTGNAYSWVVSIADGGITTGWNGHAFYVWPVRGGTEFHRLTILKEGSGGGTVTSAPGGINCGIFCTHEFAEDVQITLTAVPDSGATFTGWSGGGCSGTGDCVVTMTENTTVTASFAIEMETQGTIGTQFTINGTGFGLKKGKVLLGTVAAKIAKDGWQTDSIACTVSKVPLPPGSFDIIIKPQPYKTVTPITLTNAFTVVNPEIDSESDAQHGAPGTEITIYGRFFSTKKGKVSIEYEQNGQTKRKNCSVRHWSMDPVSGVSELRFVVPKGLDPGTYTLWVTNKVGSTTTTFTID